MPELPHQPIAVTSTTPDLVRTPFGFVPHDPGDRLRSRAASLMLASFSLKAATALHPALGRSANHRLARTWAKVVTKALDIDLTITGTGHVDARRQYLVMPLHEGFIDIPTLLHLPLDLRFTVREELFSLPHVGPYMAASRQISIPDSPSLGGYKTLYADVAGAVTASDNLVVFPQGSILGVEIAFQAGVARLSRRFGLPVLPVVISGTHRVWEYPFTRTVRFGQPVSMAVLRPIDPADVSVVTIRSAEREMKALALGNTNAPVRRFVPHRDGWWDAYAFDIDSDFPQLGSQLDRHRRVH